jgi:hypothetical protein
MGPITKLAIVGFTGLALLVGALGIRTCSRVVFHHSAAPTPVSFVVSAADDAEVQEAADPIAALSALTDFEKLATLNPQARSINTRVKKMIYWLYVAEKKGIEPEQAINRAFASNGNSSSPKAASAKAQLIGNFRTAKLWGLYTKGSLPMLKRGEAVQITRGTYAGQYLEIDHIVPLSRYPEFANDLANLQLLPQSQNRSKGDRMGALEFEKLKELQRQR